MCRNTFTSYGGVAVLLLHMHMHEPQAQYVTSRTLFVIKYLLDMLASGAHTLSATHTLRKCHLCKRPGVAALMLLLYLEIVVKAGQRPTCSCGAATANAACLPSSMTLASCIAAVLGRWRSAADICLGQVRG